MKIYLDAVEIPAQYILKVPEYESALTKDGKIIASGGSLTLSNTSGIYDDMNPLSQFFGSRWYDKTILIYDDINQVELFVGKIKNLIIDSETKTTEVKFINYIIELSQTTLIYTSASRTGADIIHDILLYAGVPEEFINNSSFVQVASFHVANSVNFSATYTAKDNINCQAVIDEICRITSCYLYTINNIIYLYNWQIYAGETGYAIFDTDISGGMKTEYSDTVFDAYTIGYDNSGTVAFSTGTTSGATGNKIFAAPDKDPKTTTSASVKLLMTNATGAAYCGALILNKNKNQAKTVMLKLRNDFNFLQCGDQIDITFDEYIVEPVLITKVKYTEKDRLVEIEGEFRNLPVNVIDRDTTAPSVPDINTILPYPTGVFIRYAENTETEFDKYLIAFTSTIGMWEQEYSNLGLSPVDIRNPSKTPDGFAYSKLFELRNNLIFYVKMLSVSTLGSRSAWSEIRSARLTVSGTENYYKCVGDPYSGLSLDELNPRGGLTIPDYELYGDMLYGSDTYQLAAAYDSFIYRAQQFTVKCQGSFDYSIRTSADNLTWGAWSEQTVLAPTTTINNDSVYCQLRFIFKPRVWSDDMMVYITQIIF